MPTVLSHRVSVSASAGLRRWLFVACGAAFVADAVFLIAMRVIHFGVVLPLLIGLALLFLGLRWSRVHRWLAQSVHRQRAWRWMWAAALLWLASVAAFWVVLARAGQAASASQPPAAIVVLGSGTPGGQASPILAARLDAALVEARRYPDAWVVVSGGVDFNETVSEGRVMGDYLRARGLSPQRIVQEEKSTSTQENLMFSRPLLQQRGVAVSSAPTRLVTSDFHTLRAGWIARREGYGDVALVAAPTPLYARYNAWLREYFAVISGFALREFG